MSELWREIFAIKFDMEIRAVLRMRHKSFFKYFLLVKTYNLLSKVI